MVKVAAKKKKRSPAYTKSDEKWAKESGVIKEPTPVPTVLDGGTSGIIKWVGEARPDKDLGPAMTFYIVRDGEIRATNGKITASYPWPDKSSFLVSGIEFEKVLARMGEDSISVTTAIDGTSIFVESEKFSATIETMPPDTWAYPGVQDATWLTVPPNFVEVLRSLRAFINDNPAQAWAGCVAIENGNMYATNNIAIAGMECDVGDVNALLPSYAVDFLLRRVEGLESWAWTDNYVAFKWSSGAWVRSQLVIGKFPERAGQMVRDAYGLEPSQPITDEFREAFGHVSSLAEDTISIYADRMESKFKRSKVVASTSEGVETPSDADCSIWGAAFLAPVISQATHWQPSNWPKPAPFRGDNVAGFIVGRKGE